MELQTWSDTHWAVVGFSRERAAEIMSNIEAECGKTVFRKIHEINELRTEFEDGTLLKWIRANNNAHGNKFGRMWCDKNIDRDVFVHVILPMYRGRREDIVWL